MSRSNRINPLVTFFLLAFAITWVIWWPRAVAPGSPIGMLAQVWSYGPAMAAVLTAAIVGGRHALANLGRGLVRWRVGWRWYGLVLLGPAALALLVATIHVLSGGTYAMTLPWATGRDVAMVPIFIVALALTDGLGEEIGWRGFALPYLLKRWSPLAASLVLGLLWALWHLPLFWTEGMALHGQSIPLLLLELPAQAIIYTWIVHRTGGSTLIAILFHASLNAFGVQRLAGDFGPVVIETMTMWTVALILLIATRPWFNRRPASALAAAAPAAAPTTAAPTTDVADERVRQAPPITVLPPSPSRPG